MVSKSRPARIITVTCKHRVSQAVETFRFSNERITKEDAVARAGHWLNTLGWGLKDIMVKSVRASWEDHVSADTRYYLTGSNEA